MTNLLTRLDAASMNLEVNNLLNGFEETTYLSTYLESTGDEPPCLHITPNSMYPYSHGSTELPQPLSSTRYQWQELYAAWRLATVLPDSLQISGFLKRDVPCTLPMDSVSWMRRSKVNWQNTASTMWRYAKPSLNDS